MQRRGRWAAAVIILVGVAGLTLRQADAPDTIHTRTATCSLATLRGTDQFSDGGVTIVGTTKVPFTAAGDEGYYGDGTQDFVETFSTNGVIMRHMRGSGTHTVNVDGTGSVTSMASAGTQRRRAATGVAAWTAAPRR